MVQSAGSVAGATGHAAHPAHPLVAELGAVPMWKMTTPRSSPREPRTDHVLKTQSVYVWAIKP